MDKHLQLMYDFRWKQMKCWKLCFRRKTPKPETRTADGAFEAFSSDTHGIFVLSTVHLVSWPVRLLRTPG